jgi:hypothetical protein|tara:strand:- start:205 stop:399 length:195 start_codon:yes stop_codon:yes gene_type:complete
MSDWLLKFRGPNADPDGGLGKAAVTRALEAGHTKEQIKDAALAGSIPLGKAAKELLGLEVVPSK